MIWSSLTWTALAAFCVGVSSRKITPYTDGYINYTTVPGYFLQDDPTTNASTFNYVCPRIVHDCRPEEEEEEEEEE